MPISMDHHHLLLPPGFFPSPPTEQIGEIALLFERNRTPEAPEPHDDACYVDADFRPDDPARLYANGVSRRKEASRLRVVQDKGGVEQKLVWRRPGEILPLERLSDLKAAARSGELGSGTSLSGSSSTGAGTSVGGAPAPPPTTDPVRKTNPLARFLHKHTLNSTNKGGTSRAPIYPAANDWVIYHPPGHRQSPSTMSSDVSQGGLGNCWLLGALAAAADAHPGLIRDIFANDPHVSGEISGREGSCSVSGAYVLRLNVGGLWIFTILDDYFPCREVPIKLGGRGVELAFGSGGSPYAVGTVPMLVFASSGADRQLWPVLVEKAFAKLQGCYENIRCEEE